MVTKKPCLILQSGKVLFVTAVVDTTADRLGVVAS
jgi:hypothetical protein